MQLGGDKIVVRFVQDEPGGGLMVGDITGLSPDKAQRYLARGIVRKFNPADLPPPAPRAKIERKVVRFVKDEPGGPHMVSDVAGVPVDKAERYIARGIAVAVQPSELAPAPEKKSSKRDRMASAQNERA